MNLMITGENKLKSEAESALRNQQQCPATNQLQILIDRDFLDGRRNSQDSQGQSAQISNQEEVFAAHTDFSKYYL